MKLIKSLTHQALLLHHGQRRNNWSVQPGSEDSEHVPGKNEKVNSPDGPGAKKMFLVACIIDRKLCQPAHLSDNYCQ